MGTAGRGCRSREGTLVPPRERAGGGECKLARTALVSRGLPAPPSSPVSFHLAGGHSLPAPPECCRQSISERRLCASTSHRRPRNSWLSGRPPADEVSRGTDGGERKRPKGNQSGVRDTPPPARVHDQSGLDARARPSDAARIRQDVWILVGHPRSRHPRWAPAAPRSVLRPSVRRARGAALLGWPTGASHERAGWLDPACACSRLPPHARQHAPPHSQRGINQIGGRRALTNAAVGVIGTQAEAVAHMSAS